MSVHESLGPWIKHRRKALGLTQEALADRIGATHSGVPVLFVSGYADDTAEASRLRGSGRELLGKPFRPPQLVDAARRLLDATRGIA